MSAPQAREQDLIDRLRPLHSNGTFEAHVTVEALNPGEQERFRSVCASLGVKSVLIELPEGATRSQPMTSSYHRGSLQAVAGQVADIARSLRKQHFPVTRIKLEAVVGNTDVPETDEEAQTWPAGNYFEFHVKVSLPVDADLEPLRVLCRRHRAHLSSNAFQREGNQTQRFVTLRVYGGGRLRASQQFEFLLTDLERAGYSLSNRLREYTIYDSNQDIDAGWIDPPVAEAALDGDGGLDPNSRSEG